mmetsp:Transcript_27289/g.41069  ORF Transcript_27289/g.41069 Transcript_27289/m.41069 type:complete len:80 (-) Transcript_27289:259-498(-)
MPNIIKLKPNNHMKFNFSLNNKTPYAADTEKFVPVDSAVAMTVPDSLIPCMKLATINKLKPTIISRKIALGINETPRHV